MLTIYFQCGWAKDERREVGASWGDETVEQGSEPETPGWEEKQQCSSREGVEVQLGFRAKKEG